MKMKTLIASHRMFYGLFFIFMLAGGLALLAESKGDLSAWCNAHHTPVADLVFKYATWLGDGITVAACCLILLFVRFRYALVLTVTFLLTSAVVDSVKQWINEPRPVEYFHDKQLNTVSGVPLYHHLGFPSGHTAAAFALFCTLALFGTGMRRDMLFFALALLVAASRVYLLEHFLLDVYFGSLFGVVIATWVYLYFANARWMAGKTWPDASLLRMRSKVSVKKR